MKSNYSKTWNSSKQPRKQRKYRANAPLSIRKKMISSHFSKELRTKYKKRSLTPRTEDTVKIMRGKYKGKTGKILKINLKKLKLQVEGAEIIKKDGSKKYIDLDPSNVLLTQLNLTDKLRVKSLEKK